MSETKDKILDSAEKLFGEHGYAATSLRQIIAEAGVNLAAVHYHFGSKEELLDEVVTRMAGPVNIRRLALLDRYEAEAGTGPLAVERVLEAFLLPAFSHDGPKPATVKMMGRIYGEGVMPALVAKHFQGVITRFFAALRRALPDLPEEILALRAQFLVGAMRHTMFGLSEGMEATGFGGAKRGKDVVQELVAFVAGGFRAPVSEVKTTEEK